MNKYDIAIIGGGAAGSIAGIFSSKNKRVILIERNDKIGKKILATGNGRCNITNINTSYSKYYGATPKFIDIVLNKFNVKKTMSFFNGLGLILKEENEGRIFPRNNQAQSVVDAINHELNRRNVTIKTNSLVRKIAKSSTWEITLEDGEKIIADKLIVTTGGKAAYQFGSSGDGYFWLDKLGHHIIDTYPALVPIETKEIWVKLAQGIKIEGKIATILDNKQIFEKTGDILFTHYGISGPAAMAQARFIAPNINKNIKIHIDIFPDKSAHEIDEMLREIIDTSGKKSIKNCLSGAIPNNLSNLLLKNLNIDPDSKSAEISKINRKKIAETLKNIELTPLKLRSLKEAQVTSGGIDTKEINPDTMESKIIPNLYLAGEIIDVDGESGGYNLQWAWSSGYLAGTSATND
jgi:predicted Rossmann fold flavoprotein